MTHDDLVRFRAGFASCELVMLVDLSAGTVLMSDSTVHLGQERLDRLCETAGTIFAGDLPATGTAILSAPTGSHVFLQSPVDPSEVLCGLFGPAADLAVACSTGSELFGRESLE